MNRAQNMCVLVLYAVVFCAIADAVVAAQQPPQATDLPGSPYSIKQTWIIGGTGPWDYLTIDAAAERLFIAHGKQVQVVDMQTGTTVGQIAGLQDAHEIALDSKGEFGYVSDGLANEVKVFDRRTYQVVASIPTGSTPRALVLEPQTGLLFAICTNPFSEAPQPVSATPSRGSSGTSGGASSSQPAPQTETNRQLNTSISVIDTSSRRRIGEILMPGKLGFAQADGDGQIFVLIANGNQVARLDAQAVAEGLHWQTDGSASTPAPDASGQPQPDAAHATRSPSDGSSPASQADAPPILDWSHAAGENSMRLFRLGAACREPRSLAVDGSHQRLFAACSNMKLEVLNAGSGEMVTSLPIGPGADSVGYDSGRGLIYIASGGAQGTLTIIRQDVTDTYTEIQNLPTRQRARTLAFNPDTGQVYLVTDYVGVNLAKSGGIGTLRLAPVPGSFQVLVIGP